MTQIESQRERSGGRGEMGEEEREKEGGERERVEGTKYNGEYLRRGKGSKRIGGEREGNGDEYNQNTLYTCV